MKVKKVVISLAILIMVVGLYKMNLLKNIEKHEKLNTKELNIPLYVLDEIIPSDNKIIYDNIKINIPETIGYKASDCIEHALSYACTNEDGERYLTIMKSRAVYDGVAYKFKLATANTEIIKTSLLTSTSKLETTLALHKARLVYPINEHAILLTYGSQNVILTEREIETGYEYVIDNYSSNTVVFKSKEKIETTELLNMIKSIESNKNFKLPLSPKEKYTYNEAKKVMTDALNNNLLSYKAFILVDSE